MITYQKTFQAHRGYWQEGLTENTLEALAAAKKRGSLMAEFDVRLTRDYVPVLYHDKTLKRLHQAPVVLSALSLEQARSFAPNLTTLEEVLTSSDVPEFLNIELKTDSTVDPALEIRVAQSLRKHHAEERALISSFNPLSLIRAKAFMPKVARALLVSEENERGNYWFLKQMKLLPLCEARFLHWDHHMASPERVEKFLSLGYEIACYTVNDAERARELLSWGVQSIISDRLLSDAEESSEQNRE